MGEKKPKDMSMDEYEDYYKELGVPKDKINYCKRIRWILLSTPIDSVGDYKDIADKEIHGLFIMLSYYQYQAGISDKDWVEEYMKNSICDIGYTKDDYKAWVSGWWFLQVQTMKTLSEGEFKQKISGNFITTKMNTDFCELYDITEQKLIAYKNEKYPTFSCL